ncbi:MAG: YggT family protein [Egibacteraceae bacterium]
MFIICWILQAYYLILIVRIILSWVPNPPAPVLPIARGVSALTDPLLMPLRGVLPPVRMGAVAFDLSPIVLFFIIIILQGLFCR